jgi:hypothetical protein
MIRLLIAGVAIRFGFVHEISHSNLVTSSILHHSSLPFRFYKRDGPGNDDALVELTTLH